MQNRRDILKSSFALMATVPLLSLPQAALAASGSGTLSMKKAVELRKRPRRLEDFILEWILRWIKRGLNKEELPQFEGYLKERPDAIRGEVRKVARRLTSGDFAELPDDKFQTISIRFGFKFKPPNEFEISIKITF